MKFVYLIVDSGWRVRYVGAATNPYKRLIGHIHEARAQAARNVTTAPFHAWLRDEVLADRIPTVLVVHVETPEWKLIESQTIVEYRIAGHPILNVVCEGRRLRAIKTKRSASRAQENTATGRLRKILVESGITQAEIARRAGVGAVFVNRFLGGHSGVALEVAERLADAVDYEMYLAPW